MRRSLDGTEAHANANVNVEPSTPALGRATRETSPSSGASDAAQDEPRERENEDYDSGPDADADDAATRENVLFDIVVKMRQYLTGAKHRRGLTKYKNCFTGRQAVQYMLSANIAKDSDEAVAIGNELMAAKLIVGVNKTKFEKRSYLYRYHLGVAPGISAARYFVSTELLNIETKMGAVRTVVDRHTGAVEALSSEHAAAMERVERVISTLRLELSVLRASVISLTAYVLLPFFKTEALEIVRSIGIQLPIDVLLRAVAICALCSVAVSTLLGIFKRTSLSADKLYEVKASPSDQAGDHHVLTRKRSLREELLDSGKAGTPSSLLKSAASFSTRLGSWNRADDSSLNPEDRADPPLLSSHDWPDAPVALRMSPLGPAQVISQDNQLPHGMVRAQIPFDIDTELFKGQMVVYVRDLKNSPGDIFNGKARTIHLALQGKFKREIPMDEITIGQYFVRPLVNLPSSWLLSLAVRVIRAFGAKYSAELTSPTVERPSFTALLALAAQALSCEPEGDVQDIEGHLIENVSGVSSVFPPGTTAQLRTKILSKIIMDNRKQKKKAVDIPVFDTERVWTFGFWQAQINFTTYKVELGVGNFNLANILNGQPLALCARTRAGEIVFRLEVWHEQILAKANEIFNQKPSRVQSARRASKKLARDLSSSFSRKR